MWYAVKTTHTLCYVDPRERKEQQERGREGYQGIAHVTVGYLMRYYWNYKEEKIKITIKNKQSPSHSESSMDE